MWQTAPDRRLPGRCGRWGDGRPFYKVENTTMLMPRDIFDDRLRMSDPKKFSWEMAPCKGATLEDIDTKTLTDAINGGIAKGRIPVSAANAVTIPERLSPFKVLRDDDVLTNGAIALFGRDPYKFFLHCKVRLARFEGVIMDKFRDQFVMEGNLFQQFQAIQDFCRKHMFMSGDQDDFDSKNELTVPLKVVREAALNHCLCKCLHKKALIELNVIKMTRPEVPNSRLQQYVLTDIGRAFLDEQTELQQAEGVSMERVNRLIAEFAEALPRFEIGLPAMEEQYKTTLPIADARLFQAAYKMEKDMFADGGTWIYDTPELYLTEIQTNIWQHYNVQFLMHRADASYQIRFSDIKAALKAIGVDGRYAVITSFYLGTYDAIYGGDTPLDETAYGYRYGDVPIYRVPSHEDYLIVMRKEQLPRCAAKIYEGPSNEYRLINEQHLLYSNLFNMKDEGDGLGLVMMRDIQFFFPEDKDFHYVKLIVDRMERKESELEKIKRM